MEEERAEEATAVICAGIDEFHETGSAPHRDTHLAQEALRSCFAAFGNVHRVFTTHADEKPEADAQHKQEQSALIVQRQLWFPQLENPIITYLAMLHWNWRYSHKRYWYYFFVPWCLTNLVNIYNVCHYTCYILTRLVNYQKTIKLISQIVVLCLLN